MALWEGLGLGSTLREAAECMPVPTPGPVPRCKQATRSDWCSHPDLWWGRAAPYCQSSSVLQSPSSKGCPAPALCHTCGSERAAGQMPRRTL